MNDREIVIMLFERKEQALRELETNYGKLIYRVCNNLLRSSEDTKECVNDTYLAVWNSVPPNEPDPMMPFICRIARNLSMKKLRSKATQKRSAETLPFDELENTVFCNNTQDAVDAKEMGRLIDAFLSGVSEENRVIFINRYWFCCEIDEIAKLMAMSKNNVYKRLSQTRQELRIFLEREGIDV